MPADATRVLADCPCSGCDATRVLADVEAQLRASIRAHIYAIRGARKYQRREVNDALLAALDALLTVRRAARGGRDGGGE